MFPAAKRFSLFLFGVDGGDTQRNLLQNVEQNANRIERGEYRHVVFGCTAAYLIAVARFVQRVESTGVDDVVDMAAAQRVFNIEATHGTAEFLKKHGIRTREREKISEGSEEILDSIRRGYVNYVINTRDINSDTVMSDGYEIRRCAVENNVTMFTALDTVRVLLDVLEETTLCISTVDAD